MLVPVGGDDAAGDATEDDDGVAPVEALRLRDTPSEEDFDKKGLGDNDAMILGASKGKQIIFDRVFIRRALLTGKNKENVDRLLWWSHGRVWARQDVCGSVRNSKTNFQDKAHTKSKFAAEVEV